MCAIAGLLSPDPPDALRAWAARMGDALAHRGPDDSGVFVDADAGLALAHRRLAVLDLSAQGHQPMVSACGRYVLVFNGEVYNFAALRRELEALGERVAGGGDSAVLLAALARWGVAGALPRLNGMYAFALWDRHARRLTLARDRLGKKPLYYGHIGGRFAFASQLFALRTLPGWRMDLDPAALRLYLHYGFVPAPATLVRGIFKLPPGAWLEIGAPAAHARNAALPAPRTYWSCVQAMHAGLAQPVTEPGAALEELDALLTDAVGVRLASDVPLGAFLSGGVDSSLVVALMQRRMSRPARTFSLGFDDPARDETPFAAAVARHLGTQHSEIQVSDRELLAWVPRLPEVFDEPLADLAQVSNLLVAQHARRDVTVVLSGDGGDEFFGGYDRYWDVSDRYARLARWPRGMRRAAAAVGLAGKDAGAPDAAALYDAHWAHWPQLSGPVSTEAPAMAPDAPAGMMLTDQCRYLPDAILVKVDRTSMAHALEVRSPLLDYRVAEFSWRLPSALKHHDGRGKWPLRALLARHVAPALTDRAKRGFAAPVGAWVTGPLRGWAQDLLSAGRLRRQGLFDPAPVLALWNRPRPGQRAWQRRIWCVLMLQAWLEQNRA